MRGDGGELRKFNAFFSVRDIEAVVSAMLGKVSTTSQTYLKFQVNEQEVGEYTCKLNTWKTKKEQPGLHGVSYR